MAVATTEQIQTGPFTIRFLVRAEDTAGSAAVFECDIPAGAPSPPPHSHDAYEETIYGVRGTTTWTVDGVATEVGPGDALCIPRGAVHSFANTGTEDATKLCIVTPGLLGPDYFREMGEILNVDGPPDIAAALDVMRRHGLTPAV